MNQEFHSEDIGERLGVESVETAVAKVEAYCEYEQQRIALTNQPKILALQYEGSLLQDEERDLIVRLRRAPPPGDLRSRRRRASYYWGVTAILALTGFVFSLVAFDPFRLGWKTYLYCLGIAVLTPLLVETTLEKWKTERFFKFVATVACLAALLGLVLLAIIRGNVLAEQIKNTAPVIAFDDVPTGAPPQNDFYDTTVSILRLVMALLALAMELGAGLALREAWQAISHGSEDPKEIRKMLSDVRQRMTIVIYELTTLENESAVFVSRFWGNFYRGMVTHSIRSAITKLWLFTVVALAFARPHAQAQIHSTLVIAIDLTQSVATTGPDHESEFQKNIDGVTQVLSRVPADSRVTVLGITDKSFAQPYIILAATIPGDAGYFGERLNAARDELVRAWKGRSARLKPEFRYTDIIGALEIASQVFEEQSGKGRKTLFIFSDMRHCTPELDLESLASVKRLSHAANRTAIAVADLHGVEVYALGVDASGKSILYWQGLQEFWSKYFARTGASLKEYSSIRERGENR